ncbi:hypothetical protein EVAR_103673_1 [Eumeta japonica]|uniref:Uncharacterized protein n=1 Tax=Eumeta variegata TaxID=151549 RepID=A0A4C1Z573_EUMVA|nr:hypothetical protein EVAR_103673_1 [Eumeta japonica]
MFLDCRDSLQSRNICNKITAFLLVDQHARSTRATRRAFPFLSCHDLLHIRIRFSSASIYADADVEIDADVPHVRMRMRIFATSLVESSKPLCETEFRTYEDAPVALLQKLFCTIWS